MTSQDLSDAIWRLALETTASGIQFLQTSRPSTWCAEDYGVLTAAIAAIERRLRRDAGTESVEDRMTDALHEALSGGERRTS